MTTGDKAHTTRDGEKPLIVQLWLDGALTSEQAVMLALTGAEPAVKIWAHHLMAVQMVDPKSIVTVTNAVS